VHKPNTINGNFYGADVAAPVFKRIAQKIFTDSPSSNTINNINKNIYSQEKNYNAYYTKSQNEKKHHPKPEGDVRNRCYCFIGNKGLHVKIKGG
jgi:cell division protein FtsI (penicillin-binding protein 3)